MADTYSATLGWLQMGIGGDNNTWGTNLNNSVFQIFEDAIANPQTFSVTGGTLDLSTNAPPAGPSAARFAYLIFQGTLTANQTVIVPNLPKWWMVTNGTTGGFTLSMKTPSGTAVPIPQGGGVNVQQVYCTGGNVITLSPFNWAQISMRDGSAGQPSYSFLNEQTSGWYRAGTQDVRLSIAGADVLQVTGAGAGTPSVVNVLSPNVLQQAGTPVRGFSTGDVKLTFKTTADPGWIMMDDGTIGDASSNANHASAANSALFQLLYANLSDADAPILTSGGSATTRGAQGSPATAFANHCRLTLSATLGRALAVAGAGAGLTSRTLGHAVGEETHILTTGEMPAHTHANPSIHDPQHSHTLPGNTATNTATQPGAGNRLDPSNGTITTSSAPTGITLNNDQGSAGGGGAHNIMQPTTFLNVMICL